MKSLKLIVFGLAWSFVTFIANGSPLTGQTSRSNSATSPLAPETTSDRIAPLESSPPQPVLSTPRLAADPPPPVGTTPLTDADRLLELQDRIEKNTTRLESLQAELAKATQNLERETTEYNELKTTLEQAMARVQQLKDDGELAEAEIVEKEVATLQQQMALAKEQLDLVLKNQKLLQEQASVLQTTLPQDQAALDRLKNPQAPAAVTPEAPSNPATPQPETPTPPAVTPGVGLPGSPTTLPAATDQATADTGGATAGVPEEAPKAGPVSKKAAEAEQKSEEKEQAVAEIETQLEQLAERKKTLEKAIELEKQRLQTSRQQQESMDEALRVLEDQFTEKLEAGAAPAELQELRKKIRERENDLREVRTTIAETIERYQQLRTDLLAIQAEELQTAREATNKRREAEAAKRAEWLVKLQETLRVKGPLALSVLVAMIALWWITNVVSRRIVGLLTRAGRGTIEERQNRSSTLVSVFHNATNLVIVIGGSMMILELLGMPIQPLLGGAAVVGLAVAFGAQNLIRDYFYGFIILLENQYKLNDIITIKDKTGVVEKITLRITMLRDLEGRAHFMPNGEITSVTNHTLGWAQAMFDIGVAYKEDVDYVMEVLLEVAAELKQDPEFGSAILEDARMLGVDKFADSAVMIKFVMKTRSDRMFPIRREMLRRIKNRFDELNIEIPFPHRTVFMRPESTDQNNGAHGTTSAVSQRP